MWREEIKNMEENVEKIKIMWKKYEKCGGKK